MIDLPEAALADLALSPSLGTPEARAAADGTVPPPAILSAAAGLPMPLNRMSGTDSQRFRWKSAVGPLPERTPQITRSGVSEVCRLGPLEWVRACATIDPAATFTWTFNCVLDEPQDHADLVEYLCGVPGENRDGGEDWAARRVAHGRSEPVPVAIWELGNELDYDKDYLERFPDVDAYIAYCRRTITAVRRVQPKARFAAHAATAAWAYEKKGRGDWRVWHRRVLKELGPDLDWLAFHPYYHGLSLAELTRYLDVLRDDVRAVGGGRIGIYLSEHARWPAKAASGPWYVNWHQTHDLSGCLSTAQAMCLLLRRSEITAAAYHGFNAGPWGVIRDADATGRHPCPPYATGIATLYTLLAPLHAGRVVACTTTGERADPTRKDATADAVALLDPAGRLRLLLVNREPVAARVLRIEARRDWRCIAATALSGPTLDAVNGAAAAPLRLSALPAPDLRAWTVPARSIVLLTCLDRAFEPAGRGR